MTRYEIDDATGLPKLPEDHFWSVYPNRVVIRKSLPPTEWSKVRRTGFVDYLGREETRSTSVQPKNLFKKEKVEKEYRLVNRYEEVAHMVSDPTGEVIQHRNGFEEVLREPVTKENLLALCEKATDKWEAQKIYGDYPPKKFEA